MALYQVTAKRWEHGWELHVADVGITQAKRLAEAEQMAAEYVSLMTGEPVEDISVVVWHELGHKLDSSIREARTLTREAMEAQREAAIKVRALARALKADGLTGRDIAAVLDISAQRASQILADK
jgi:hypothetical protein